jgi:hypothetical protein
MQTPIHASQVYAFLRRNYRVSRNTRALWQFQQIAAASSSNSVRIPTTEEIVTKHNIDSMNADHHRSISYLDAIVRRNCSSVGVGH